LEKCDILSLEAGELEERLLEMGEKSFRAKQVYSMLHVHKVRNFDEITSLSKALRAKMAESFYICCPETVRQLRSEVDGTVKFLFRLEDGNCVETVFMRYHHGNSLCISTQVGCRMGCRFCASAIAGFVRHLRPSEILAQLYEAERQLGEEVDSIVLMGIGEPLDNFDNVVKFLGILSSKEGRNMSLRHVTMSTCGLVPKIDRLSKLRLGLTLSVSLHAADNVERSELMPVNKAYPIEKLLAACRNYIKETGRRISFEYAVIEGHNSSREDARKLALLLRGMNCHVNLIPINEVRERDYHTVRKTVERFRDYLEEYGINTTIRRTLGSDIEAACGQLRRDNEKREGHDCIVQ
jgi:23S rRNA (adenine2503-C2)-methyltransferase